MSRYTQWGYGDSATWPPYSGHSNDPRAQDDVDSDDDDLDLFDSFDDLEDDELDA